MLMPDVNVLIYAHRTEEQVHHEYARWLKETIDGPSPFALSVLVAVAFVRVVTNPKAFAVPTPLPTALAAIDHIVAHPRCRLVAPGPEHWREVARLCRATHAKANLVADAQHAALAITEGCTFVTRDGDFARFVEHGLSWRHLVL